jgi:hypothetical protein
LSDQNSYARDLDRYTEVRHPASDNDGRISVAVQDQGATLTLFFPAETGLSGEADPVEVRITPPASGKFEPWRLLPQMPLYAAHARALLAYDTRGRWAALLALQEANAPGRGLSDGFLRMVAEAYRALVAEGERYPVKAMAASQHRDKSTVSRWISAARQRGFLEAKEDR